MKKTIAFLMAMAALIVSSAAFAEEGNASPRILVAFLSRAGENYNVGITRKGSASAAYAGYVEKKQHCPGERKPHPGIGDRLAGRIGVLKQEE